MRCAGVWQPQRNKTDEPYNYVTGFDDVDREVQRTPERPVLCLRTSGERIWQDVERGNDFAWGSLTQYHIRVRVVKGMYGSLVEVGWRCNRGVQGAGGRHQVYLWFQMSLWSVADLSRWRKRERWRYGGPAKDRNKAPTECPCEWQGPKWSGEVRGSRNKEAGSTEAQEQERERERMEVNIGREVWWKDSGESGDDVWFGDGGTRVLFSGSRQNVQGDQSL